jgi:succinate dehydrogenase / fumarate reductase membrane anchor subunit
VATYARAVAQPRSKFELYAWLFMRLSGVLLVPLAFGHLAIMHIINNVHDIDLNFVALRWAMLGWRIYDAALLGFAFIHGLNGFRYVVDDYVHNPRWNRAIKWVMIVGGAIVLIIGSAALIGGVRQP